MPRELLRSPEHDRNRSLGWFASAWMEYATIHGPGDVQGQPVVLDDELVEFTVDSYALDAQGRRLYDSAFFSRAKGRDKSGHAGRIVLFEAFGPARFERWAEGGEVFRWRDFVYEFAPGEPIGRPIVYPFIRCLATEEGQAGNTYDNVHYNLTEGPLSEGLPRGAAGLTRTFLPHGGEIVPSSASNAAKDGGKETLTVFDETHLYVLPELRKMYATVRRNLDKRKLAEPWSLETSTMYLPGEGSVAEETHKAARDMAAGVLRDARLLFDHREAPPDVDLTNRDELVAALREVYGPFAGVMDLDRIIRSIWDPRNTPEDSRRYWLNQATSAHDAWIAAHEWAAIRDPAGRLIDGDTITLGFDGSRQRSRKVTDATALIACRLSDGLLVPLGIWEQPEGPAGQGWRVPVTEVDAAVHDAFKRFHVVGFYADPAKWEGPIGTWEGRYGHRLKVKATRDHPIEWWMGGGRARATVRALERFLNAVIDREISHDASYVLTKHALAARRRVSKAGVQISKSHPDSPHKIDALVASVLAHEARADAIAAGVTALSDMGGFTF
ncbi:hypothetical protein [Catellatospora sp. NPDC049609]|uniref:hypothetical protein n=1 Tax=Catellatospora sp. NPDC049609 TaxID=3155505 RepID=UPI003444E803